MTLLSWEPVERSVESARVEKPRSYRLAVWSAGFLTLALFGWQFYVAGPSGSPDGATLIEFGARKPNFGFANASWRLIASIFLHGNWLHLFANAVILLIWGAQCARLFGWLGCYGAFLLTGFWGSLVSDLYGPQALAVGASGGTSGLVLLILVSALLAPDREAWNSDAGGWFKTSLAVVILNVGLAFGLTGGSGGGRLDHWAHVGGAGAGLVLGLPASRDRNGVLRLFWSAVVVLALLAMVVQSQRGPSPFH